MNRTQAYKLRSAGRRLEHAEYLLREAQWYLEDLPYSFENVEPEELRNIRESFTSAFMEICKLLREEAPE